MGNPPVQYMHPAHPFSDCARAVGQLRQHTASYVALFNQLFRIRCAQSGNKGRLIVNIFIKAFNIRKESQLLRLCNGACRIVRIDIISLEFIVQANGGHNREKILFQKVIQHLGIYILHIPYKTDVFAVRIFFIHSDESAVLAADAHCFHTQFLHHRHKAFIHLGKDHFCNFHRLFVRNPQTVYKLGLLSHFPYPTADFLAASVNDNGLKAYQL